MYCVVSFLDGNEHVKKDDIITGLISNRLVVTQQIVRFLYTARLLHRWAISDMNHGATRECSPCTGCCIFSFSAILLIETHKISKIKYVY